MVDDLRYTIYGTCLEIIDGNRLYGFGGLSGFFKIFIKIPDYNVLPIRDSIVGDYPKCRPDGTQKKSGNFYRYVVPKGTKKAR